MIGGSGAPGRKPAVTIVGRKAGSARWEPRMGEMAEQAGRMAAELGFVVITGGHSGVMEHAARGAKLAGGMTVGITRTELFEDANGWLDIVIPTGIGTARNAITALAGDCVVGVPGGLGTMQEMSYALEFGRPVFSWDSWQFPEHGVLAVPASDHEALRRWLSEQYENAVRRVRREASIRNSEH